MTLNETQMKLLKALVAAQVAVFEWGNEDVRDTNSPALNDVNACLKEASKLVKKLREL